MAYFSYYVFYRWGEGAKPKNDEKQVKIDEKHGKIDEKYGNIEI